MIAELFYPKELKDHIVDLRANGDLNEEVLANYPRCSFFHSGIVLFFYPILIHGLVMNGFNIYISFLISTVIFFVYLKYEFCSTWNKFYEPYISGERHTGVLIGSRYSKKYGAYYIIKSDRDGNKDSTYMRDFFIHTSYRKGEKINYIRGWNGVSVVVSPECMKKYCLKKSFK